MTEQELILTTLLDCRWVDLYVDTPKLTPQQEEKLAEILKRRKNGEPLQYLLGNTEFMGLKFFVDERVLIPRPETELLIDAVLEKIKTREKDYPEILDIGTGSGNIAVGIAKSIPQARITALDVSQDALDVARVNVHLNGLAERITLVQSDVFSYWQNNTNGKKIFDIIISNPPYVVTDNLARLPQDVQKEPKLAIDGGEDGLVFYRRIIREAPDFLREGGLLAFEMGDGMRQGIEKILRESGKFQLTGCISDYACTERVIIAERKDNG